MPRLPWPAVLALLGFVVALELVSAAAHNSITACASDEDCSLLGVCHAGKCACDSGWVGEDCGVADLLPLRPNTGYSNDSAASWGGRPVFSGGKWHLFATEIARQCPLILFMNNSQVIRAEATSPQGPYTHKEVVLAPFHHNPQVFGPTPDGYYLLFSIGNTFEDAMQIRCEAGVPQECTFRNNSFCRGAHMPNSNGRVNMAYSRSVEGPWSDKVILPFNATGNSTDFNCENNNPTAAVMPNGTVVVVYRADPCKASAGGGAGGG